MTTPERYIGLMSGTSMDGIDAACVDFSTTPFTLLATYSMPIPAILMQEAFRLSTSAEPLPNIFHLDKAYGALFSHAVLAVMQAAGLKACDIQAIGAHGQTLRHAPKSRAPCSIQIGAPTFIAERTGIPTVYDFRNPDIALGGQGAPLAPAFHAWLSRSTQVDRCIINIGGIANITWLPRTRDSDILGYDVGPGNCLLDTWIQHTQGMAFDALGAWAAQGASDPTLLAYWLDDYFFAQPPPKSTGTDTFNLAWIQAGLAHIHPSIAAVDVQQTLSVLTATLLSRAVKAHAPRAEVYLCGGGVHNRHLTQQLSRLLGPDYSVCSTAALGLDPDWVEAVCFAWMARERLALHPTNVPSVTGAHSEISLGKIALPGQ